MHYITYKNSVITVFISIFLLVSLSAHSKSWRLAKQSGMPDWFSISGEHRTRFENLDEQYCGTRNGSDQVLLFRTLIKGVLKFESMKFVGEMIDSRSRLADAGTPLSTSVVNPLDLLQGYIEIPINNLFFNDSKSKLRAGRFTMNVGSRRLVARNRFRNTINNFTGVDWQWTGSNNHQIRMFYTLPVQRLVDGNILDNEPAFDKQDDELSFWGLYYKPRSLPWGDNGEVYLFGLDENDSPGRETADRDIYTLGFRLYRAAAKQQFDYQIESVYQFGDSRSSTSATRDLDHRAHFQHLEIGYSFDAMWSPRLLLQYDYASGDDDSTDNENNRFSTLFGARRFDFGPTSIYGPFARANLSSPGIRLTLKPSNNTSAFVALRGFWLASSGDAWTTARITPTNGNSYIGTQLECRVRWEVIPKNIRIESGLAHLIAGDVMDAANKDSSTYFYTQASVRF